MTLPKYPGKIISPIQLFDPTTWNFDAYRVTSDILKLPDTVRPNVFRKVNDINELGLLRQMSKAVDGIDLTYALFDGECIAERDESSTVNTLRSMELGDETNMDFYLQLYSSSEFFPSYKMIINKPSFYFQKGLAYLISDNGRNKHISTSSKIGNGVTEVRRAF